MLLTKLAKFAYCVRRNGAYEPCFSSPHTSSLLMLGTYWREILYIFLRESYDVKLAHDKIHRAWIVWRSWIHQQLPYTRKFRRDCQQSHTTRVLAVDMLGLSMGG